MHDTRPEAPADLPPLSLSSLPAGYRAVVVGAGGALGGAFAAHLAADPRCGGVLRWGRSGDRLDARIDLTDEASIAAAAAALPPGPLHALIVATGVLHADGIRPEKRLADWDPAAFARLFAINATGPALLLKHLAPRLDRSRSLAGFVSAKVGSIADNRLGGWAGYRASKAALNMLLKTAAIELARTHPGAALAALHPGTVKSTLSRPFRGDEIGREPALAAAQMLAVLDGLTPETSGSFFAYDGTHLPW